MQWILAKKNFLEQKHSSLEEYDDLAENLVKLEHKHCLKKLKSALKIKHISYKQFFTELAPKLLAEEGTHILFFGGSYQKAIFLKPRRKK